MVHHQFTSARMLPGIFKQTNEEDSEENLAAKQEREGRCVQLVKMIIEQWLSEPTTNSHSFHMIEYPAIHGSSFAKNFRHFESGRETVFSTKSHSNLMYLKVNVKLAYLLGDQGQPK
jgi:hypothetical protein